MKNFLVAYDNQADGATLSAAPGSAAWQTPYPLINLQDYRVKKLAKTANAAVANTKFRFSLAAPAFISMLALANTNASVDARFQWLLYTDNTFTTAKYDSGVLDLYPLGTIPFGAIPWGAPNWWTGRPLPSEIALFQRNIAHVLSTWQYAQYGEFRLLDSANADGYFSAGRFMCAQAFQPRRNAQYGAAVGLEPRTRVDVARDGTPYFDVMRANLVMPFAFPQLSAIEGMKKLQLDATVESHGEVFAIWDHSDPAYWFQRSLMGRLAKLDRVTHPKFANFETAFQVEGIL
ncbi:hypothetical protein [Ramlibacter sp.]|uniref:hypothetical protein n=1 Tax=Ramlibacter sp. TaxID=1917967 RepID=UPI003D0D5448